MNTTDSFRLVSATPSHTLKPVVLRPLQCRNKNAVSLFSPIHTLGLKGLRVFQGAALPIHRKKLVATLYINKVTTVGNLFLSEFFVAGDFTIKQSLKGITGCLQICTDDGSLKLL